MRILVTGGAGYIGDAVVEFLLGYHYDVVVLDDLIYGGTYMRDVEFIRADITDFDKMREVFENGEFDSVVHLAALVGDGACAIDPRRTSEVNLRATENLVRLCNEFNTRFVFASTCSVYGANNDVLDEFSKTNPLSVYAQTKLAAEHIIVSESRNYTIFRLGTLFGMSTDHARIRCDLVANILTYRAARGETLEVHGGEQWRPLLHVKDAARAFALAAVGQFHCGLFVLSYKNYTIIELAEEIVKTVGNGDIKSTPRAFEDLRNYKVDNLTALLAGFEPQYTVQDGVREMHEVLKSGRISDIWSPEFHNAQYMRAKYG